jgi:hypothetical protein
VHATLSATEGQLAASPLEAVNQRHRRSGQRNGGIAAWVLLHSSALCAAAMPTSMAKGKAKAKPRAKAMAAAEPDDVLHEVV